MGTMNIFQFAGRRTIKTGIAVFLTALICHLMNWSPMFAVVTAIVTIEPTAIDSIKKAFIRFPATAIGTAIAMLFTFWLGDSVFTYTLVAVLTIIACYKLKLTEGMIVATLTGVLMISTVHQHYFSSFFVRLETTTTGLIVASLVNVLLLPPKYSVMIASKVQQLCYESADILTKRSMELLCNQPFDKDSRQVFQALSRRLEDVEKLCSYQKKEWRFHRIARKDIRAFHYEHKKLMILRQLLYHIGNIIYLPSHHFLLDQQHMKLLTFIIQQLKESLYSRSFSIQPDTYQQISELRKWFLELEHTKCEHVLAGEQRLVPETAILYELLSIYHLIQDLHLLHHHEMRHQPATTSHYQA